MGLLNIQVSQQHVDAFPLIFDRLGFLVAADHLQQVEQLPLVFVEAFHLHVEQAARIERDAELALHMVGQALLVGALGGHERLAEPRVFGVRTQFTQAVEIDLSEFAGTTPIELMAPPATPAPAPEAPATTAPPATTPSTTAPPPTTTTTVTNGYIVGEPPPGHAC